MVPASTHQRERENEIESQKKSKLPVHISRCFSFRSIYLVYVCCLRGMIYVTREALSCKSSTDGDMACHGFYVGVSTGEPTQETPPSSLKEPVIYQHLLLYNKQNKYPFSATSHLLMYLLLLLR